MNYVLTRTTFRQVVRRRSKTRWEWFVVERFSNGVLAKGLAVTGKLARSASSKVYNQMLKERKVA